jgi:hypothetical protein
MKSMLTASMENIQVLALSNFLLFFKLKILEHTVTQGVKQKQHYRGVK